MTPWTEAKAAAIARSIEVEPWNMPAILAMLTSPTKEEREQGKAAVRSMVMTGRAILERETQEEDLRQASERFEL